MNKKLYLQNIMIENNGRRYFANTIITKERMLLEDGKKQEDLCVQKYQGYADLYKMNN